MRRTSGLSLLILIFVSLCLITFSLLSVSESRADQALGENMEARTHTVSFSIAITESQQLAVVLAVDFPKKDTDTLYHITTWEIVNTQDWAVDTSMKLLRTDMPESET